MLVVPKSDKKSSKYNKSRIVNQLPATRSAGANYASGKVLPELHADTVLIC
jgi:hypothetical protein